MSMIRHMRPRWGIALPVLALAVAATVRAETNGVAQSATPELAAGLICEAGMTGSAQLDLSYAGSGDSARISLSCSPDRPASTEASIELPLEGLSWSARVTARAEREERTCEAEGDQLPVSVRCEVDGAAVILRAPNRDAPGPAECQGASRSMADLRGAIGTPVAAEGGGSDEPAPFAISGDWADQETAAAVQATIREMMACANAGDYPRLFALLTDAYLVEYLEQAGPMEEDAWQYLEAPPVALAWDQQAAILSIDDIRVMDDGRSVAMITIERLGDGPEPSTTIAVFVHDGDRWLLDGEMEVGLETTSTPGATP